MGVGIDLCKISRISLEERFIDFVLSKREQELMNKRVKKEEFVASRFAAKEAFLKANHKGIGDIKLNEIEVLNKDNGAPYIIFNDKVFEEVSISHEDDFAVAVVIIYE